MHEILIKTSCKAQAVQMRSLLLSSNATHCPLFRPSTPTSFCYSSARLVAMKSFKSFEARCHALDSNVKSHGDSLTFPEPLIAPLILSAGNIGSNQRVSIITACLNQEQVVESTTNSSTNIFFVQNNSYETITGMTR